MDNVFNRFARQALVFLATLIFLIVSTVALTHCHVDSKLADESHCAMCMAVHSATHVLATPNVTLFFAVVEKPFLVPLKRILVAFVWTALNKDRAPPSL
jgi:hypothetical protein